MQTLSVFELKALECLTLISHTVMKKALHIFSYQMVNMKKK